MHPHESKAIEKRFILSLLLTGAILVAEVIGSAWTGSLALLSDAGHVLSDLFALGLSFVALRLSARPPDEEHSYGFHRVEVLAALVNGATLLFIAIGIGREAWERWQSPTAIRGMEMLIIAVIGLVINLVVAFILGGHQHMHESDVSHSHHHARRDLNLHSAFLHVAGDAISSVGVILAALVIWLTGLQWVDPLVSVLIALLLLVSAYRVLRSSLHILIEGVPEGISSRKLAGEMRAINGVQSIHDLHIWSICSGRISLSAHVVLEQEAWQKQASVLGEIKDFLDHNYGIDHSTLQLEQEACSGNCP